MLIKEAGAAKIKDSRGQETIEVSINGCRASSPSGKSTGKYETPSYYRSLENNIKLISSFKEIIGLEINSFPDLIKVENLIKIKLKLKDAKQFGANALFALESAVLKALAKSEKKYLWQIVNPNAEKFPVPLGNAVGGGLHSHAQAHPYFQEFLIIPKGKSIFENSAIMNEVYGQIGKILNSKSKNDEGAWEVSMSNEEVFEILNQFRDKVDLGIDIAASTFYKDKNYNYKIKFDRKKQIDYIKNIIEKYNLYYVEDPLQEEDFLGFKEILKSRASSLISGDDLTATQIPRLLKAIKDKSINAMIIKPNQNGSLLELKEIFSICKKNGIKTILSHRSGETLDNALADYAFAFQADFIKTGISTKWREVKLKRLVGIEKSLK